MHLTALTDQKQAVESLADSEQRFRSTFEQAAVGIAHVAENGRFLRLNQKFCHITGYSHDELSQRSFVEITHPDDLDLDLQHAQQLYRGDIPYYSQQNSLEQHGLFLAIPDPAEAGRPRCACYRRGQRA